MSMEPFWIYWACLVICSWTFVSVQSQEEGAAPGVCDPTLGHYPPLPTGKCPQGTEWHEQFECCVKCVYCPPGFTKLTGGCHGECVRCPEGTFSSPDYSLHESCAACTACPSLHRSTVHPCSYTEDAVCGPCSSGYLEVDEPHYSSGLPLCKPCSESDQHTACSGQTSPNQLPQVEDFSSLPVIIGCIAGFIVLLTIILVVVYLRKRKKSGKRGEPKCRDEEHHPLQRDSVTEIKEGNKLTKNGKVISEPEEDVDCVDGGGPAGYLECPTIEVVNPHPPHPPRTPSTSSRRVQFADADNTGPGPVDASSEEDSYSCADRDDYVTALGYPTQPAAADAAEKRSYQSLDDDDDAAAAWAQCTGSNKTPTDSKDDISGRPKPSPRLNRIQHEHEFSSLPQSLKGQYVS